MGTSFYREWKLKFSDMRLSAGIILLVFAGGLGIQYFLHDFHGDKGYLPLGTLMAAFSLIMILLVGLLTDFYMSFHLAVSYGTTRKQYLCSVIPVYLLYSFLFIVGVRILLEAEKLFWESMGVAGRIQWSEKQYLSFLWLFGYALLLTGVATSLGTLICRWKKAAFIVIGAWILLPGLLKNEWFLDSVKYILFNWDSGVQAEVLLAAGGILCVAPFLGIRKIRVEI